MARASRRKTSRPRRKVDWVVQPATYALDSPPYVLDPGQDVVGGDRSLGEMLYLPLTAHGDILGGEPSRTPEPEQTAVRVKGAIEFGWNGFDRTTPPPGSVMEHFHARIMVVNQTPGTLSPATETVPQYDMRLAETANDDLLWEYQTQVNYVSGFWDISPSTAGWVGTQRIDVDVKSSRRLRQREVLVLAVHVHRGPGLQTGGVFVWQNAVDLFIWVEPVFRTLIRM